MCGRYYIAAEDSNEEIRRLLNELGEIENFSAESKKDVCPSDTAPVVANNRVFVPRPFLMRWGFEMKSTSLLINARSETVGQKALFRELFRERRALIPASGYYEWEKAGRERVKYSISCRDKCIYMAGLYRPRADGKGHEFVILTKDAEPSVKFIHERMPVIFDRGAAHAWLSKDSDPETVLSRCRADVVYESENAQLRLF